MTEQRGNDEMRGDGKRDCPEHPRKKPAPWEHLGGHSVLWGPQRASVGLPEVPTCSGDSSCRSLERK